MMKRIFVLAFILTLLLQSCSEQEATRDANITRFANNVSISATPTVKSRNLGGYFLDQGSWAGYTIPSMENPVAGFCGPYDIDNQNWISNAIVTIVSGDSAPILDTTIYYPGSAMIKGRVGDVEFTQDLYFIDNHHALLKITTSKEDGFDFRGVVATQWKSAFVSDAKFIIYTENGEVFTATFPEGTFMNLDIDNGAYTAKAQSKVTYVVLSYLHTQEQYKDAATNERIAQIAASPESFIAQSNERWSEYITKTVREDMPEEYNRIAVKAVQTLISNWKSAKGDLYHDGIIPSHAVWYFNGFWAWDSWKHAAAIAYIEPELAKDQVRTMFDYQWEDGMVIDCIYTDKSENNERDTKSSIVAWAVKEIFAQTQDTAFVREMLPKMVKYHNWWYQKRDINKNNLCEFGSTDGTLVAAKWESGMDNAVRFDNTKMQKLGEKAYTMNQESVDLNTFLVFERDNLLDLAQIAGVELQLPDHTELVRDYFYNKEKGFFYDRLHDGKFLEGEACEGWLPLWTKLATAQQAQAVKDMIIKPSKFSTYIPFPTCAEDVKGFDPEGYWRGAVWLDQAYFGIRGLRNYGYTDLSDNYTRQIFERCEGLMGDGPITENYNPLLGTRAEARHFSWSAAHILMLYNDYGKNL